MSEMKDTLKGLQDGLNAAGEGLSKIIEEDNLRRQAPVILLRLQELDDSIDHAVKNAKVPTREERQAKAAADKKAADERLARDEERRNNPPPVPPNVIVEQPEPQRNPWTIVIAIALATMAITFIIFVATRPSAATKTTATVGSSSSTTANAAKPANPAPVVQAPAQNPCANNGGCPQGTECFLASPGSTSVSCLQKVIASPAIPPPTQAKPPKAAQAKPEEIVVEASPGTTMKEGR